MIWEAAPTGKRGRQPDHSDAAIQTCLTMKVLFGVADIGAPLVRATISTRQTTGFVESLLHLIDLDWAVPNFSTLSRRQSEMGPWPQCGRVSPKHGTHASMAAGSVAFAIVARTSGVTWLTQAAKGGLFRHRQGALQAVPQSPGSCRKRQVFQTFLISMTRAVFRVALHSLMFSLMVTRHRHLSPCGLSGFSVGRYMQARRCHVRRFRSKTRFSRIPSIENSPVTVSNSNPVIRRW